MNKTAMTVNSTKHNVVFVFFRSLLATAIFGMMVVSSLAATPTISSVTAQQRYPWNGKVDISYTVVGPMGQATLSVSAEDRENNMTYTASSTALSGDLGTDVGTHHIVWDLLAQGLEFKSNDVVFTVTVTYLPSYLVKYNANGGSGTMADQSFAMDSPQTLAANDFTRTGYTFVGWAMSANGAKVYDDQQSVSNLTTTTNATVNLYAKWTPNTYKVGFYGNGADNAGAMNAQTFTYDVPQKLTKNIYARTGYVFREWGSAATGGSAHWSDEQEVVNMSPIQNRWISMYAIWDPISYTVRFNKNASDATGTMANQSFTYDRASALRANAFSRTDYTFTGWATSASGAKVYNDKQSVSNLTATAGVIVDLYAKWEIPTYTVKFNANGGSGTMTDQVLTYDKTQSLQANSYTRNKYRFAGWSTSSSGSVQYANKASVKNLAARGATITLYAVWDYNPLGEGIDQIDLIWTTDSTNPWNYYTSETIDSKNYYPFDNTDGVKSSGAGGGVADSWMQTTITGPATFSFRYAKRHYSSTFTVLVDGSVVFTDSTGTSQDAGVVGWTLKSFSVGGGNHTIRFNYHHPGKGWSSGGNGIRLDTMTVTHQ